MSPCIPFSTPGGGGFICSRGGRVQPKRRFCVVCLETGVRTPAGLLCDFPTAKGETCDAALCESHAVRIPPTPFAPRMDWCPRHRVTP